MMPTLDGHCASRSPFAVIGTRGRQIRYILSPPLHYKCHPPPVAQSQQFLFCFTQAHQQIEISFPKLERAKSSVDIMSCCGGNCGCGSACKCGNGCGGCKMYPDLGETSASPSVTLVSGVAPKTSYAERGYEMEVAGENGGCQCGSDCKCDPCTCK